MLLMHNLILSRLFVLILFVYSTIGHYDCIHDEIVIKSERLSMNYTNLHARTAEERQSSRLPIRIVLDTSRLDTNARSDASYTCYSVGQTITTQDGTSYKCGDEDVLTAAKSAFAVDNLLQAAVDRIEKTLSVDRVSGNLMASNGLTNCYSSSFTPLTVPTKYKTTGQPDCDLLVFVTARHITVPNVLAFASECQHDQINRATIGFINFDPASLDSQISDTYPTKLGATTHELSHVLGYSSGKFDQFVNPDGSSIPQSSVVFSQTSPRGDGVITKIKTPIVLETVRRHFNCSTLDGAEIENQGSNGTAYSHWEKRLFGNEYLVGTTTDSPQLSNVTLAYFQDSGWYNVDYSQADTLRWGYGLGCDWVNNKCSQWTAENYFCSSDKATSCNFDRTAQATCNLVTDWNNLDKAYQYFPDSSWGGADLYSDYCPYYQSTRTNGAVYCADTQNQGSTYINTGENFCATCKCFSTNLVANSASGTMASLGCYNTTCVSQSALKIKIGSFWYDCPQSGKINEPGVYAGQITCPSTNVLCAGSLTDNSWPAITSIDPSRGGPSTSFTIKGRNFKEGMIVAVDEPCADCKFVDSQTYTCNIAPQKSFTNPKHLLGSYIDLTMVYPNEDKSAVLLKAFYLKVTFSDGIIGGLGGWISSNPVIATIVIIIAVIGACVGCYCCFREFKRARGLGEQRYNRGER